VKVILETIFSTSLEKQNNLSSLEVQSQTNLIRGSGKSNKTDFKGAYSTTKIALLKK
jgi:hypothetical protein